MKIHTSNVPLNYYGSINLEPKLYLFNQFYHHALILIYQLRTFC